MGETVAVVEPRFDPGRATLDLVAMRRERERIIDEEVAAGRMERPGPEIGPFGVAGVDWWV
jgi:hypothetical protein